MRHTIWKNVDLPPLSAWKGIAHHSYSPSGEILIDVDETGTLSVDFSPMRPGVSNLLVAVLDVTPTAGQTAGMVFADKTAVLTTGMNQVELESLLPLDPVLTITGVKQVKIISLQVQIRFPDKSKPVPYDLIGFDMMTSNMVPSFIIGRSRIGKAPLGGIPPISGGFRIGASHLDLDTLQLTVPEYTWKDILGQGLSLSFRMGANHGSTLLPVAQVGTATIEIKDFDPRKAQLRVGLQCRIYHRITRRILYTGTLASFSLTPAKDPKGHDVATLEFVDTVGKLAGIKRYGVRSATPETLSQRIERLLDNTGLKWKILEGTPPVENALGSTVAEANLASYMDDTLATVAGAWWVNPDGTIIINPNNEITVFKKVPWFIVGETPLDGGKLPPAGVTWLRDATKEPRQVENPFVIGESRLDEANVASAMIRTGFIIGQSQLDHATLQNYQANMAWAEEGVSPVPLFTDRYNSERESYYYTDINPGFNSAETLTEVAIENHTAKQENGSWQDATKTFTATNPDYANLYGQSRKTARAYCATEAQAQTLADYYLARPPGQESALKVSSIQMNALTDSDRLTRLNLFDYCQLEYRGNQMENLIYAFENQLTPYTWKERLYLTEAKERTVMT